MQVVRLVITTVISIENLESKLTIMPSLSRPLMVLRLWCQSNFPQMLLLLLSKRAKLCQHIRSLFLLVACSPENFADVLKLFALANENLSFDLGGVKGLELRDLILGRRWCNFNLAYIKNCLASVLVY